MEKFPIEKAQEEASKMQKKIESGEAETYGEADSVLNKENIWNEEYKKIEKTADALGYRMDGGIKEAVTAFNISGLPTSSSCEGHLDSGFLLPWVTVSTPNKPKERFIGERDMVSHIAKKYKTTEDAVFRADNKDAWVELQEELSNKNETEGYIDWRRKNKKLINRANTFLADFYKEHKTTNRIRLFVNEQLEGDFRINSKSEYATVPIPEKEFSDEEKKKYLKIQKLAREEMNLFTKFLRKQYFNKNGE